MHRPCIRRVGIPVLTCRYALTIPLFILSCCLLNPGIARPQGNLLIMPRRVVFEGVKKYEELNLANIGRDTSRYVISLIHYRMKENGEFEEISQPDSGQNFADHWLRFFPHSVILGPGESQVIKLQIIRNGEMPGGEYRSHIYFRALPDTKPLGDHEPPHNDSGITVSLIPVFGISIPVIIHSGESTTHTQLSDLALTFVHDTLPVLSFSFLRTGNMSVYGDIRVEYQPTQGKTIRIGEVLGVAVYTPNPIRRFRMELEKKGKTDFHTGKLHITYTSPAESRPITLAEAYLPLN